MKRVQKRKQNRGSRNESSTGTLDHVFVEDLKNFDCVLDLENGLRNLEQQVGETFD